MICVTFAMIQDWNVKVAPVFALAFCMLASWSFLNDSRRCRVTAASALAQVCTTRSNTLYVVAPSHVSVPMSAPMSIRTSFFFMNQRVKGGLYLANRCGGGAAAAGTMLALWSAANSCLACELAVSSSQLPQKVRALRADAVSTCDLVARGNSVRDITLRDLSQSDLGIQRHGRLCHVPDRRGENETHHTARG